VRTCVEFLADLKHAQHLERDADVARYLGLSRAGVHKIQKGKMLYGDDVAGKVAKGLGLKPEFVLRCRNVERLRRARELLDANLERAVKTLAAGVGALLVAIGTGALPRPAEAGEFDNYKITAQSGRSPAAGPIYTLCVKAARRLARIAQAIRSAVRSTLGSIPGRAALGAL
jgi:transcriptional regulator with XRE-family HTH domain